MPVGQVGANCESLWEKMIGKPYSGKPNVRFDEGELEIELLATTPALYSTVVLKKGKINIQLSKSKKILNLIFRTSSRQPLRVLVPEEEIQHRGVYNTVHMEVN